MLEICLCLTIHLGLPLVGAFTDPVFYFVTVELGEFISFYVQLCAYRLITDHLSSKKWLRRGFLEENMLFEPSNNARKGIFFEISIF